MCILPALLWCCSLVIMTLGTCASYQLQSCYPLGQDWLEFVHGLAVMLDDGSIESLPKGLQQLRNVHSVQSLRSFLHDMVCMTARTHDSAVRDTIL